MMKENVNAYVNVLEDLLKKHTDFIGFINKKEQNLEILKLALSGYNFNEICVSGDADIFVRIGMDYTKVSLNSNETELEYMSIPDQYEAMQSFVLRINPAVEQNSISIKLDSAIIDCFMESETISQAINVTDEIIKIIMEYSIDSIPEEHIRTFIDSIRAIVQQFNTDNDVKGYINVDGDIIRYISFSKSGKVYDTLDPLIKFVPVYSPFNSMYKLRCIEVCVPREEYDTIFTIDIEDMYLCFKLNPYTPSCTSVVRKVLESKRLRDILKTLLPDGYLDTFNTLNFVVSNLTYNERETSLSTVLISRDDAGTDSVVHETYKMAKSIDITKAGTVLVDGRYLISQNVIFNKTIYCYDMEDQVDDIIIKIDIETGNILIPANIN